MQLRCPSTVEPHPVRRLCSRLLSQAYSAMLPGTVAAAGCCCGAKQPRPGTEGMARAWGLGSTDVFKALVYTPHLCVAAAPGAPPQRRTLARQRGAQTAGQAVHCSCWPLPPAALAGMTCTAGGGSWQGSCFVAWTATALLLSCAGAGAGADIDRWQCC